MISTANRSLRPLRSTTLWVFFSLDALWVEAGLLNWEPATAHSWRASSDDPDKLMLILRTTRGPLKSERLTLEGRIIKNNVSTVNDFYALNKSNNQLPLHWGPNPGLWWCCPSWYDHRTLNILCCRREQLDSRCPCSHSWEVVAWSLKQRHSNLRTDPRLNRLMMTFTSFYVSGP